MAFDRLLAEKILFSLKQNSPQDFDDIVSQFDSGSENVKAVFEVLLDEEHIDNPDGIEYVRTFEDRYAFAFSGTLLLNTAGTAVLPGSENSVLDAITKLLTTPTTADPLLDIFTVYDVKMLEVNIGVLGFMKAILKAEGTSSNISKVLLSNGTATQLESEASINELVKSLDAIIAMNGAILKEVLNLQKIASTTVEPQTQTATVAPSVDTPAAEAAPIDPATTTPAV